MNIGIVCYPTFGGSGVVATELGKALALKGHRIHFITYSMPFRLDEFAENIFFHEVTVNDYPLFDYPPYELVLSSKLVDVVQFEKLDVLHVHYAIPHASAAFMAQQILKTKGIQIPYITTLHGTDITLVGRDASFEPVISFAINHSNAVTAVSESLKRDTYQYFDVINNIEVIPNFICINDYLKGAHEFKSHKKFYAPAGEKIIMHISNFRPVKRVEDIIYTFKKVREQIPCKLLFVGDGPERHKIESICRELHTCNDVKFLGKVKATEQILAIADLFMLTSESESFGLAALEAMAAGVPVISTKTGGLPEVNIHGETGFMSNVGDVDDMAEKALYLLQNEDILQQFKENAFNRAALFNVTEIVPKYENLYKSVIESLQTQAIPH
jgi:N-acetyl-alpha-D-glucosaminyl L-malate synthase BshA